VRGFLFLVLAFFFFIAWVVFRVAFHVASGALHLLLVIAVIALVIHFFRGRSTTGV
jgi:hypothetical protein